MLRLNANDAYYVCKKIGRAFIGWRRLFKRPVFKNQLFIQHSCLLSNIPKFESRVNKHTKTGIFCNFEMLTM